MKRTNRRTRVPIGLYPCLIEEKMTIKEKLATEEEVEENEGLKEVWGQMEYVISDSDSDLEQLVVNLRASSLSSILENIIPQIASQVTANVNNANGGNGNGGNNGCSYKTFTACNPKEFDGKGGAVALTRWIEKLESVFDNSGYTANQRVKYAASCFMNKALTWWNTQVQARGREASTILTAGILTDEVVRCGKLTKGNDKRKEMKESSKQGSTWKNNKKSKTGSGFVATVPSKNDNAPIRQVVPVNAVRMGQNQRACYECGSLDHLRYDCPKWKQATRQARNPLALEGNRNT
uniref:CCHC-type domain-containing protein n=1 Tax=Tanacetum cinerariifolium TaxID=118510 RepID=A0A6L2P1V5_TANCI|nr:hypothetical protein [Tanacetum cinerariifolium]